MPNVGFGLITVTLSMTSIPRAVLREATVLMWWWWDRTCRGAEAPSYIGTEQVVGDDAVIYTG
jgi:hypothetical protein